MASLLELSQIQQENGYGEFIRKVRSAALLHAVFILDNESNIPTERLNWVQNTIENPDQAMNDLVNRVVADHAGKSLADIISLSDADIQTSVQVYIDAIYPPS